MVKLAEVRMDLGCQGMSLAIKVHWYKMRIFFSLVKRTKFSWMIGLLLIRGRDKFFFTFLVICLESKD